MKTLTWVPGAVAAGTPIDLPAYMPRLVRLHRVEVNAAVKTVVTTTPAAGQAQLLGEGTIVLGDALVAGDRVTLLAQAVGERW